MRSCFEVTQPASRGRVRVVREQLVVWLEPLCLPEEWVAECALALGEAATNAVTHGSPRGERDSFGVRCELGLRTVSMEVLDSGPGFSFRGVSPPDPLSGEEHGRGLWIMQAVTDVLVLHHRGVGGMRLRLEKGLPPDYWGGRIPTTLTTHPR